jgi:hypothetical protein
MSLIKTVNEAKRMVRILIALRHKILSFPRCIACSFLVAIAIGLLRWFWRHKIKKEEELPKGLDVDLEAVHKFYTTMQESPLLYPYFMHIKEEKREDVMQKISCSFHKALNQVVVAPEHLTKLQKIHSKLGVDEKAYAEFAKLFAHIYCNKSDEQRAKMLKTFSKLQKYICTGGEFNQVNSMVDFLKLPGSESNTRSCKSEFRRGMRTVTEIQGLVDGKCLRDAGGERAGAGQTVKQLPQWISV